ncbi:MAG TPA: hypothetical protein VNO35_26220 [Steroidobacteraceae bacterium]|nr:hypothetical protein [Steroidobacteraceae bacterium]
MSVRAVPQAGLPAAAVAPRAAVRRIAGALRIGLRAVLLRAAHVARIVASAVARQVAVVVIVQVAQIVARAVARQVAVVAIARCVAARLNAQAVWVVGQRIALGDATRVPRFRIHLRDGTGTGRALGPAAHEPPVLLVAITTLAGVLLLRVREVMASVVGTNVQRRTAARRRFLLARTNLLRQWSPLKMAR